MAPLESVLKASRTVAVDTAMAIFDMGFQRTRITARPLTAPELAALNGARRAPFPKRFKPQLATLVSKVPAGEGWLNELKFDGYRIVAQLRKGNKPRLITRNDNDWTARFQVVAEALAKLPVRNAILDGEVVSLDERGVSNFQQLQNSLKTGDVESLAYYVFDAPYLEGFDLSNVPLVARKEALARLLLANNPDNEGFVRYSDHVIDQGQRVFDEASRAGMEGIIAKRADSTYHQARTADWLKIKCKKQQEFVIAGYSRPEGSRVGFGALLLGYYEHGELIYAGRVGTGFTTETLKQIAKELNKRRVADSPYDAPPTGAEARGVTWVKPELVGEVEFTEWTSDGRLRHPSFHGLREDKPAKQVVREMPKPPNQKSGVRANFTATKSTRRSVSQGANTEISIAGVRLTHPDHLLYPEDNITKRDLAEYYVEIGDWILPYVAARPLTLVRCPGGYQGKCFFQKHLTGSLPDAIRGVMVEISGKREKYVAIDDVAGLVALVQMSVLELHPWAAREDNLERPDQLVFDLDPGEAVEWKQVVQGARDIKARLEDVGLQSFLRTTGGKGLHVVVPLARRNDWDECKLFAKSVADAMTRDDPRRYIATMSKAKRRGKIFIDYLRNQRGATAIASYSTRRRPGAPVATPLAWEELSARTKPGMFNISNLPKRLDKLKADPWGEFFRTRQSITAKAKAAFQIE